MGYLTSRNRVTERTVEVPWLRDHLRPGRVLDIGSSGADYLTLLPPGSVALDCRPLTETTAPPDVHVVEADARALPFRAARFAQVVFLSTLEHIGCASAHYGTAAATWQDAQRQAALEAWRVLQSGGELLVTLPYGRPEHLGWQVVYDAAAVAAIFAGFPLVRAQYYRALGDRQYAPCVAASLVDVPYQAEAGGARADGVACLVYRKER